jgi:tetratricopeptide (TPR) repeat protein
MRRIMVILLVSAIVLTGMGLAYAGEELFDTKAAAVHVEKGITHLKEKKYDAAIKELEEAVTIDPDAEAYYYLGYAYYMKGKKGDAESRKKSVESFDKAYELNPSFTPSRFKPADAGEAKQGPKSTETGQVPAPAAPAQPAEPTPEKEPDQQTSGKDEPSQPTPPFKATDKVKNLGTQ